MKIIYSKKITYISAAHEDIKNPQAWKKVLLTHSDLISGKVQMVNWAKLPKGNSFQAHYHEDMEEIFIIISGKVKIICNNEAVILEKGDAVVIQPKEIHEMTNISHQDVYYIVIGITQSISGKTIIV